MMLMFYFCKQAATGICAPLAKSTNQTEDSSLQESTDPLPKHVVLEMEALSIAQKQSMAEAQKQKNAAVKARQQKRLEMKRAIEESRAEYAVYDQCKEDEEAELQKALALSSKTIIVNQITSEDDDLKLAIEQSLLYEQERREQQKQQFEEDLNKVLQQSTHNQENPTMHTQEDLDLLKILELSFKEQEVCDVSEEDAFQRAIQLSQQSNDTHCADNSPRNEVQYLSIEETNLIEQKQIIVTDACWFYIDPQESIQVGFVTGLIYTLSPLTEIIHLTLLLVHL
jgi:hypothetical protein